MGEGRRGVRGEEEEEEEWDEEISCSTACGDVKISYPFGFEAGCSWPGFELICRDTIKGKKPFLPPVTESVGYLELESISLLDATRSTSPAEAYRLSDTENKFIIVGCYTVAYITVGDREDMRYASACSAFCGPKGNNLTSLMDGACSGTGCCEATITEGHTSYNTMFDPDYNTTQIYNVSSCSYAVLMESSRFSFRRSYVMNSSQFIDTNGGRVPMVVDWAVQNASNCVEAQKDHDSYACISSNSVCVNSSSGPGYICNCTHGYQGNPYLLHGCQGEYVKFL
uniref:OSJNBb0076A22.16 protein n=1 Tax=Oryza sativa subsp. japonica TaxID=39947 RepID=Q7XMV2_ORYSJ|nr:OSJNBb0076A22.16 [Oryza sativa Japonica Group]